MGINRNWPRWVYASVVSHFDNGKDSTTPLYVTGEHEDIRDDSDLLELRMDGPAFTELSKDYWRVYVEVNILAQAVISDSDAYIMHRLAGQVAALMDEGITVYKYGAGGGDDSSELGCLKTVSDARGRERIQISHFGQIEPATNILQATIEGHFEMHIKL